MIVDNSSYMRQFDCIDVIEIEECENHQNKKNVQFPSYT